MGGKQMAEVVNPLTLQFLAWVSSRRRTYDETMEAWQTTCPRHSVWEDAVIDGLIQVTSGGAPPQAEVTLTPKGRALLEDSIHRPIQDCSLARA
jgi:hypothetical protein